MSKITHGTNTPFKIKERFIQMKVTIKRSSRNLRKIFNAFEMRFFKLFNGRIYANNVRSRVGCLNGFGGRVFVDLSVISQHDAGTGIQRVVRAIAFQFASKRGEQSFEIIFVSIINGRHFRLEIENSEYKITDELIEYLDGDLFIALDFSLDSIWQIRQQIISMRHAGVRFWYVIYDFLPLIRPQWFSSRLVLRFWNWLAIMGGTADRFLCISEPVARQLPQVMKRQLGISSCPPVDVIPMGWDLVGSRPSRGLPEGFSDLLKQLSGSEVLLQVGTIEPRKGHRDSLAAMECLWAEGSSLKLVLVGDVGWKMDAFIEDLYKHPEFGRRLFWTGRISDEALDALYAACTGTIFPSLAEGFGLPVVESLAHKRPVLARRLDVFEGLEGQGVTLFDANASPGALALKISEWIEGEVRQPFTCPISRPTWEDAADFILQHINDQRIERK